MTKMDQLKDQLKLAKEKLQNRKDNDASQFILDWYEGYTDGLERAIDIMKED